DLIDPEFSDLIDDIDDVAVADANATLDVHNPILLVLDALKHRVDFFGQLLTGNPLFTEVVLSIGRNRNNDRRLLNYVRIDIGIVQVLRQSNRDALLQELRDHHEDDQQHQHDVDHGSDVDFGL